MTTIYQPRQRHELTLSKFIENLLFGLAFGLGFTVAQGLLRWIASVIIGA